MNDDTINLLKECNSGSKMAVESIDELMDKTQSRELFHMLTECKDRHTELGNEIHELLNKHGKTEKDIPPIAKAMSWLTTNMKMMVEHDDKTIADIMTDGCNMGIKTLNKHLHEYENADNEAKEICKKLIKIEENFSSSIRPYL